MIKVNGIQPKVTGSVITNALENVVQKTAEATQKATKKAAKTTKRRTYIDINMEDIYENRVLSSNPYTGIVSYKRVPFLDQYI